MKQRFSTYDVICMTTELQSLVGLRVNQIYDIDNKTYLIKFQDKDVKVTLLMESGIRFHTTSFEWPKNPSPSGFTMKLRKHLKNKRLECLRQLGTDRILDFQFGIDDAAYHLILELYDRGNIILCDYEMTILNVLRPHTEGETVRFVVREKYPEARARVNEETNAESIRHILNNVKKDDNLKQVLMPVLDCGPTVLTHVLLKYGLSDCKVKCKNQIEEHVEQSKDEDTPGMTANKNKKGKKSKENKPKINENKSIRWFDEEKDFNALVQALEEAGTIMKNVEKNDEGPRGFIIQKSEKKPATIEGAELEELYFNVEYHPMLFEQFRDFKFKEFAKFDLAVDEFYSTMVGQKIDLKTYQQECEALKKLSNVKKDHEKRLEDLSKAQELNKHRAELITRNQELINSILFTMRSLIANQMSWDAINDFVKSAQATGDAVANSIKQLKLETNHVSVVLTDPYASLDSDSSLDSDDSENEDKDDNKLHSMVVDIDLGLSAYANATRYYDQKRSAAQKEHRTIESSTKALKNAERKTQQHLKEVRMISNITKARKIFWFEKFYWFISSENYLVIGGRDQQQNELIVKRYLRANDIYVHADIQGASSIVIRNPFTGSSSDPQATPPPKTLLEAGAMAISYSVAWDAKITTSAYWVRADQVSKTAPTGEYLETGSFMIRGKKNFLPPCHLILGLSVMFKLEESSIPRHAGERCVRNFDEKFDKKIESDDDESHVAEKLAENIIEEELVSNHSNDANDSSSENDDDPNVVKYPDTHTKTGNLSTQVSSESNIARQISQLGIDQDDVEEESAIIHAVPQQAPRKNRIIHKEKQGAKKKQQQKQQIEKEQPAKIRQDQPNENKPGAKQMSKHQKKKLKIIKSKYKDQDEEERQMRLEILQSAGKKKTETKKKEEKDDSDQTLKLSQEKKRPSGEKKPVETAPGDVEALEDDDNIGDSNDVDMLNSLTGCPCAEDELLFALPIVAPYNALQNYKFKVKITPGTARRGKTSKTALMMFLKDKTCSNQEKDLMKAIKHDTAARNMPGKVKMSAPQLQRLKN